MATIFFKRAGDHQQLRPKPAVHELAVKYHLDVSMFERLIRSGVNYVALSTQHRMRPEVAKLISPAIYPSLLNHPSVADFPSVLGVAKNVFFVDHTQPEEWVCVVFLLNTTRVYCLRV